jgi:hypothetical protein
MRALVFTLLLVQSWKDVFSYYPCTGFVGNSCGNWSEIRCCDGVESANYVFCYGDPNGSYYWTGPVVSLGLTTPAA